MTYQKWIDVVGFEKARQVLGYPDSTLRMWYGFHRFPRAQQLNAILTKTSGLIDLESWVKDYCQHQDSKDAKEAR